MILSPPPPSSRSEFFSQIIIPGLTIRKTFKQYRHFFSRSIAEGSLKEEFYGEAPSAGPVWIRDVPHELFLLEDLDYHQQLDVLEPEEFVPSAPTMVNAIAWQMSLGNFEFLLGSRVWTDTMLYGNRVCVGNMGHDGIVIEFHAEDYIARNLSIAIAVL